MACWKAENETIKIVLTKSDDLTVSGRYKPFKSAFWKGGVSFSDHNDTGRISIARSDSLYLN